MPAQAPSPEQAEEQIFQRLEEALEASGMTQAQLARALETRASTVNPWFSRKSLPSASYLAPLARELGVTVQWLVAGEDEAGTGGQAGQTDAIRRLTLIRQIANGAPLESIQQRVADQAALDAAVEELRQQREASPESRRRKTGGRKRE